MPDIRCSKPGCNNCSNCTDWQGWVRIKKGISQPNEIIGLRIFCSKCEIDAERNANGQFDRWIRFAKLEEIRKSPSLITEIMENWIANGEIFSDNVVTASIRELANLAGTN